LAFPSDRFAGEHLSKRWRGSAWNKLAEPNWKVRATSIKIPAAPRHPLHAMFGGSTALERL